MKINLNNLVSITEANQNFSRVAQKVNEDGTVVIMKNNKPRYVITDYKIIEQAEKEESSDIEFEIVTDKDLDKVANEVLREFLPAFKKLAE